MNTEEYAPDGYARDGDMNKLLGCLNSSGPMSEDDVARQLLEKPEILAVMSPVARGNVEAELLGAFLNYTVSFGRSPAAASGFLAVEQEVERLRANVDWISVAPETFARARRRAAELWRYGAGSGWVEKDARGFWLITAKGIELLNNGGISMR